MINCDYKVSIKDIQNKYKFKIFATGGKYDDSDLRKMIESVFYALPRVNGTGTFITLNDTAFSYMKNKLNASETSQDGTPTPDNPQQIYTVTGDNEVEVCGKNLFDFERYKTDNPGATVTGTEDNFYTHYSSNFSYIYLNCKENTAYTISYDWSTNVGNGTMRCYYTDGTNTQMAWSYSNAPANGSVNFTSDGTKTIEKIGFIDYRNDSGWTIQNLQIEEGLSKTTYEPYKSNSVLLTLGDKEICKIGDYEDKIFKAIKGNEIYDSLSAEEKNTLYYGKWYLRKNIGKVVLDGSETWWFSNSTTTPTNRSIIQAGSIITFANADYLSNYFIQGSATSNRIVLSGTNTIYLSLEDSITGVISTDTNNEKRDKVKAWLGTHNTIVYYVLSTPTNELFNDTIGEQLEDIYNNMLSYEGQTNINQVNDDLPFIIDTTAMYDLSNLIPSSNTLSTLNLNRLENTNINPTLEVSDLDVPLTLNKLNIEDEPVEINTDEDIEEVENTEEEPNELDVIDTPIELENTEEEPTEE